MEKTMKEIVDGLTKKALAAQDPTDAMKFSQAALNAANSYATVKVVERG